MRVFCPHFMALIESFYLFIQSCSDGVDEARKHAGLLMRAGTPKYDAIMTQSMDDPKKLLMSVKLVSVDALNEHGMLEPPP